MPSQTSVQFVTKTATSTSQFIESIGVNTHLAYNGSPYANTSGVVADLNYLGIHAIRDQLYTTTLATTNLNTLATLGYKFDFEVTVEPNSTVDVAKFMQDLNSFQNRYPGSIGAIEGPNEVNTWKVSYDGVISIASGAEIQKQIYTAANADALLKDIPVYNVTIGSTDSSQFAQLGDLSNYTDYANSHAYVMSTTDISAGIDYLLSFAGIPAPGKPMVITEAGYTTLPSYWYDGVSESVHAKYMLTTLLDAYQKGVAKTYLYELIDDTAIPSTSIEAHFGLFNGDGSPKLAAVAIHNLTTILRDTGSAGGSLTYALSGTPTTSHDMVLAKSDGSKDLVLWAEPVLWDQSTQSAVASTPSTVTVTFDQTEALVKLYDPLLGSAPIAAYTNVNSIQVAISDHPVVIEVIPRNTGDPGNSPPPPPPPSNQFGSTVHDVLSAGGEVYALYDAILGRTPDLLGLEGWASILKHGTASLHDVAASLLASPEGQSHVGSPNNATFVEQLYETALHRPGDSNGVQGWTNALNQGASRADIAIGFALSAENVAGMQTSLNAGVFVPDQNAANVARLYYGVLGREPDSAGLSGWTGLVDGGSFSFKNLAQAFLNSHEYQNAHAGQGEAQFIDDLYVNALGRHAESAGLQGWINALSHGASHADVALGISESQEAQQHHLPQIEKGWLLA